MNIPLGIHAANTQRASTRLRNKTESVFITIKTITHANNGKGSASIKSISSIVGLPAFSAIIQPRDPSPRHGAVQHPAAQPA